MKSITSQFLAAAAVIVGFVPTAQAAVTVYFYNYGEHTRVVTEGSFLSFEGLYKVGPAELQSNPGYNGSDPAITMGNYNASAFLYQGGQQNANVGYTNEPVPFGGGGIKAFSSINITPDTDFHFNNTNFRVNANYVLGTSITTTALILNQSLDQLFLSSGVYTWSWGTGETSDSLSVIIGIPEPSTYGLILGGLALAGAAVRRRKSKS